MSAARRVPAVALLAAALSSCGVGCADRAPKATDPWQYAARLGDTKEKVHALLGVAYRTTEMLEEYPGSGVTVWYETAGKVSRMNFEGPAAILYSEGQTFDLPYPPNPMPSDRAVIFGLTPHATEAEFRRTLGHPKQESLQRAPSVRERRCIWRKDGYIVDALFLAVDRTHDGQPLAAGSLLWFEVSHGL